MSDVETPKMVTLMPDYTNVTVKYSTFKIILGVILVILVIIIIGAIIGGGYASNQLQVINLNKKYDMSKFKKTVLSPTIHGEFAAVKSGSFPHKSNGSDYTTKDTCENVDYRYWDADTQKCLCKAPYWGTSCQREVNGDKYLSLGNFEATDKLEILGQYKVNNKSFPYKQDYETCQQHCDNDSRCVGFIYNEKGDRNDPRKLNQCITLSSEPIGKVVYNLNQDGNLYLHRDRSTQRPLFPHKLYLFVGSLRKRFWMEEHVKDTKYAITEIGFNKAHLMNFIPTSSINDSKSPIVFSVRHFTLSDAKVFIRKFEATGRQTEGTYVYIPGVNDLVLPYMWVQGDYWAMGVSDTFAASSSGSDRINSCNVDSRSYADGFTASYNDIDDIIDLPIDIDADRSNKTLSASIGDCDRTLFNSEWSL